MVYARNAGGRELTFDFAEGLIKDNLLFVDRETGSVWSQLEGKAVIGEMKGTRLQVVPSIQSTWKFWRREHPETRVMIAEGEAGRPYLYRTHRPGGPRPSTRPTAHDTSLLGLGLVVNGSAGFYPFREMDGADMPLEVRLGGEPLTIHYDGEAMTAWGLGPGGNLLPGILAYEWGWLDFNPGSIIYRAPENN